MLLKLHTIALSSSRLCLRVLKLKQGRGPDIRGHCAAWVAPFFNWKLKVISILKPHNGLNLGYSKILKSPCKINS